MSPQFLRTSDMAKAAGIHVNTVRLYEQWGLIPPVERSPSGYRRFIAAHLDCLLLARLVYQGRYPGTSIRRSGAAVAHKAASGDLDGALELAYRHQAVVYAEHVQAESAASLLERWAGGIAAEAGGRPLRIGEAAKFLDVTIDVLRNWERNGLLTVPRDPSSGYRRYGPGDIGRARVVRMLSRSGYSTMAILRMMTSFDAGRTADLRDALDTPRPDEDVLAASDRWLSTLAERKRLAEKMIALLEKMVRKKKERAG